MDLLLTDVVMPGGSGRELVERLVGAWPELRVLYMSGYTDDTVIRHGLRLDEIAFIQKPFATTDLLREVRRALDSAPLPAVDVATS